MTQQKLVIDLLGFKCKEFQIRMSLYEMLQHVGLWEGTRGTGSDQDPELICEPITRQTINMWVERSFGRKKGFARSAMRTPRRTNKKRIQGNKDKPQRMETIPCTLLEILWELRTKRRLVLSFDRRVDNKKQNIGGERIRLVFERCV